jgi:tRNA(adenine34) deaminase
MLSVQSDSYFMKQAFAEAEKAYEAGEIPVGAVIVCEGRIIARAHNQTEQLTDVTAHAEILAITAAAGHLGSKYLPDCTLYVTLEPCVMCAGALAWAQMGRVVYGASDEKRGFMAAAGKSLLHPKTRLEMGVMEHECSVLMTSFFKQKRD